MLEQLETYSRRLFDAVDYVGLGTCEFMVTEQGKVYFLEVNPRLQVEHTVSEEVCGLDLVREQLTIANGGELTVDHPLRGHSFELRLTCEDPAKNLAPSSGTLTKLAWPSGPGIRVDSGVVEGDTVSPKFDSMMGKLVVTASDRATAVARVRRALEELKVEGVPTPASLFELIFNDDEFTAEHGVAYDVSTKWLERKYLNKEASSTKGGQPASMAGASGAKEAEQKESSETFVIEVNNHRVSLTVPNDIVANLTGGAKARDAKRAIQPLRGQGLHHVEKKQQGNDGQSGVIASPMQAVVTRINVAEGQDVAKGDLLVVLESMKMENYVYAPVKGTVTKIFVGPAAGIEAGETLMTIDVNGASKAADGKPATDGNTETKTQPIRTSVLRAAQLAAEAEDHARGRQHVKGKLTARERLDLLLDTGSFEEIGRFRGGDINGGRAGSAVITGFGEVFGRKVAVYAQDFSVKGGTLGVAEGRKICHLMDKALDLKVPIIALIDSGGARIQEGVAALTEYGHLFRKTCDASGFVPQLSLILGPCAGGAVYCPALTDLIIMTRENSNMFVTGPDVVKAATGEVISMDDLGGGYVHNATSGVAHYLGEDEADAIDYARTVLAYLPSNSDQQPPVYAYAATRADRDVAKRLATLVPDNDRQPYDVLDVIRCIVDYGEFVQVHELFAASAVVGFACVDGHPVGIVANQPNVNAGILDVDSSEKVARFVRLCDAFNLPVVTLVDTPGYKPGAEQEHAGIIRRGAKVIYAYANAQVPLVTIILRKAFGGAYIVMGSKSIGADMNFAWPSSQIAVLGAAGAVNIIHRKDLQKAKDNGKDVEALRAKYIADYERTTVNANLSLEMGEIDAMIDPEQTRETIIESLRLLASKKRVRRTSKHHGNQPL